MTASTTRARLLVVEFQTGALFTQDDNPFATGLAEVLVYLAKTYATPEKDNRISADLLRQLAIELKGGQPPTQPPRITFDPPNPIT